MNTLPAQEIKRRGVKAIGLALKNGPVHIIKNNSPACVVLSEAQYANLTAQHRPPETQKDTLLQWLLRRKASGGKIRKELDTLFTAERDEWDQ
jgi:PHD/YefM family antitoxin component YafN of YafNO toxin-antitoxin module